MAIMLISSACSTLIKPYGFVAPDTEQVREDGQPLFIPANAHSISQGYKPPPPGLHLTEVKGVHMGIDVYAETGTPVLAVADGVVIASLYEPLLGNRVVIEHTGKRNGMSMRTGSFHMDRRLVSEGDKVIRGQQIGTLGSKGALAPYPHLHFEVRQGVMNEKIEFEPVNPHRFWADGPGIVTCFKTGRTWTDQPFVMTYPVICPDWAE